MFSKKFHRNKNRKKLLNFWKLKNRNIRKIQSYKNRQFSTSKRFWKFSNNCKSLSSSKFKEIWKLKLEKLGEVWSFENSGLSEIFYCSITLDSLNSKYLKNNLFNFSKFELFQNFEIFSFFENCWHFLKVLKVFDCFEYNLFSNVLIFTLLFEEIFDFWNCYEIFLIISKNLIS